MRRLYVNAAFLCIRGLSICRFWYLQVSRSQNPTDTKWRLYWCFRDKVRWTLGFQEDFPSRFSKFSETKAFRQNKEESPLGLREVQGSIARPGPQVPASTQATSGREGFLLLFYLKEIPVLWRLANACISEMIKYIYIQVVLSYIHNFCISFRCSRILEVIINSSERKILVCVTQFLKSQKLWPLLSL